MRGQILKIALGLAVSAVLVYYLFRYADMRAIAARLAETRWGFLALSVALNLFSLWCRAQRWGFLFPPGARPARLFNAVMIGYMGNNLLPLRAGEVLRAYVVARRGTSFWTTVTTMVVERVLDGLAVGLMLAAVFFLVPVPRELEWAALVFLSVDLALIAVLGAFTLAPGPVRGIALGLTRRWPRLSARVAGLLDTLDTGLAGIRTPSHVPSTVLWSTLIWLTLIATTWTCMLAAHLDLPILAGLTTLAFLGLGVSLPSSPGFVGVIQAASWAALRLFGVPSDDALSFSILLHASQFIPVTLWGLALLFVEHVSLAEAARPHDTPPVSTGT
ncbi:MAG TPA: lysylphosphatidylglycerol synthase transmembrane domain-containing protein [Methylomirabilota bacterium]|nr:lysylphosphatidylglycerol synthase transmembrane domain-containing protein [Methylomirabilota bacterium]